jgi:hypothetical protein
VRAPPQLLAAGLRARPQAFRGGCAKEHLQQPVLHHARSRVARLVGGPRVRSGVERAAAEPQERVDEPAELGIVREL